MITKSNSLICAEYIVNLVLCDESLKDVLGTVKSYQNGREQGLTIELPYSNISYYICHSRGTDIPTVYVGTPNSEGISEDAYKNSNKFKTEYEASRFIVKDILRGYHEK